MSKRIGMPTLESDEVIICLLLPEFQDSVSHAPQQTPRTTDYYLGLYYGIWENFFFFL